MNSRQEKKPKTWRNRMLGCSGEGDGWLCHVCHQSSGFVPAAHPTHGSLAQDGGSPLLSTPRLVEAWHRPAHLKSCLLQPGHPNPDPAALSPPELRHSPEYVTRGHSGYFFQQAFKINIHNMHCVSGVGWQCSPMGMGGFSGGCLLGAGQQCLFAEGVPGG